MRADGDSPSELWRSRADVAGLPDSFFISVAIASVLQDKPDYCGWPAPGIFTEMR
jgi:hypothetical protein